MSTLLNNKELINQIKEQANSLPDYVAEVVLQNNKALTITTNGTYPLTPDENYDGLTHAEITVNVPSEGDDMTKALIERDITNLVIPTGVTRIGEYAFYCFSSLTSIEIPNGVTSIGEHAFDQCSNVTSVTIPNSVKYIGVHAFAFLESLTSIEIPNGVEMIGTYAFFECYLNSVTIPSSVTSIGSGAFNCVNEIIMLSETPPSLGSGVFDTYNLIVKVPMSAVDRYKTETNWSVYADCIVGYGENTTLVSSDGYTLQDSDGLYLTINEEDE